MPFEPGSKKAVSPDAGTKVTAIEAQIALHEAQYQNLDDDWDPAGHETIRPGAPLVENRGSRAYREDTAIGGGWLVVIGAGAALAVLYLASLLIGYTTSQTDPGTYANGKVLFVLQTFATLVALLLAQIFVLVELAFVYINDVYQMILASQPLQAYTAQIQAYELYIHIGYYLLVALLFVVCYRTARKIIKGVNVWAWTFTKIVVLSAFVLLHLDAISAKNQSFIDYLKSEPRQITLFAR